MARTFRRKEQLAGITEINMTPLIDLAFSLLIIFMITTPLLEQSIKIDLPNESQKPQTTKTEQTFQAITIDASGKYYWGKEPVNREQLAELLENAAANPQPPVISIRADRSLPYQQIIDLIDLVKTHKLTKIDLPTQVE